MLKGFLEIKIENMHFLSVLNLLEAKVSLLEVNVSLHASITQLNSNRKPLISYIHINTWMCNLWKLTRDKILVKKSLIIYVHCIVVR